MVKWVLGGVVLVVVGVGLWAFEPWRLFTSSEIDEDRPTSRVVGTEAPDPSDDVDPSEVPATQPPAGDRVLATGRFEDAEHDTSGRVEVLELADGRRFVRFEDLASSDGPDLHVWITDRESGGDWNSYDDGRYVRLGELKATHGNQNYEIPESAKLGGLKSVVIWCDRFNVAFGTAPVRLG
jgi:hypothetical protein